MRSIFKVREMLRIYIQLARLALKALLLNPILFVKKVALSLKAIFSPVFGYPLYRNINGIIFSLDFKDNSPFDIKRMMYSGTYEMGVAGVLETFLRKGDTFIDVGANIGYMTAIGASMVEKSGRVYSFEPVPEYFVKLQKLAELNKSYRIVANQFALSDKEGQEKIYLADDSNMGASTILPNLAGDVRVKNYVLIKTCRLDEYIKKEKIENIKVIKIDTEGFEYPVLLGLKGFFGKCRDGEVSSFPIIVCEICPSACSVLGYKLEDLFAYMRQFGYRPFNILNYKKEIEIDKIKQEEAVNIIFKVKK